MGSCFLFPLLHPHDISRSLEFLTVNWCAPFLSSTTPTEFLAASWAFFVTKFEIRRVFRASVTV